MTKEIRSPNVEELSGVPMLVRNSDFGIPSDFVIRHSDLRFAVHGEPPFVFSAFIGTMNLERAGRCRRQGAADVPSAELLPVCSAGKIPAAPCGSWSANFSLSVCIGTVNRSRSPTPTLSPTVCVYRVASARVPRGVFG